MKYYLIIILTFISCNLISEENPIQQIDKETFCKEAIQETEKNECYEIKKYVLKIIFFVFPDCIFFPFTSKVKFKLLISEISS